MTTTVRPGTVTGFTGQTPGPTLVGSGSLWADDSDSSYSNTGGALGGQSLAKAFFDAVPEAINATSVALRFRYSNLASATGGRGFGVTLGITPDLGQVGGTGVNCYAAASDPSRRPPADNDIHEMAVTFGDGDYSNSGTSLDDILTKLAAGECGVYFNPLASGAPYPTITVYEVWLDIEIPSECYRVLAPTMGAEFTSDPPLTTYDSAGALYDGDESTGVTMQFFGGGHRGVVNCSLPHLSQAVADRATYIQFNIMAGTTTDHPDGTVPLEAVLYVPGGATIIALASPLTGYYLPLGPYSPGLIIQYQLHSADYADWGTSFEEVLALLVDGLNLGLRPERSGSSNDTETSEIYISEAYLQVGYDCFTTGPLVAPKLRLFPRPPDGRLFPPPNTIQRGARRGPGSIL